MIRYHHGSILLSILFWTTTISSHGTFAFISSPPRHHQCQIATTSSTTQSWFLLQPNHNANDDTTTTTGVSNNNNNNKNTMIHRRDLFQAFPLVVTAAVLVSLPLPSNADVSDGNVLPQGAAQFGRIIRIKADLLAVQKRIATGSNEMDKTEWNNVGQFLRKVYAVSDDMKAIAAGFSESYKKERAAVLVDNLKKYSKAADAPTGTQNGPEFIKYAQTLVAILDEFLELLRDVPDEL